jgi:hypothetical protein
MAEPFREIVEALYRDVLTAVPGTQNEIESQANVHTNDLVANVLRTVAALPAPQQPKQASRPNNEERQ